MANMRRSPAEYIILASLVGSLAFWGYNFAFRTLTVTGKEIAVLLAIAIFLGLGALALWFLIRKRLAGAVLSVIFYGVQVLSITMPNGEKFEFTSLPTINIWIFGEKETPVNLNVVALILYLLSIGLWFKYKQAREKELAPLT